MTSIAVLAVGIGVVWLVFWAVKNERATRVGEQGGLFRMRDWAAEERAREEQAQQRNPRLSKRDGRPDQTAATEVSRRRKR